MRSLRRILVLASAAFFLVVGGASAQVLEATLYGTVRDSTGAALPGVSVVATQQGTNLIRDTVSDSRGEFTLPALPAGSYAIKIELQGFKTYSSQGLALGAGQTVQQAYVLEVGELAETVTVAAAAPLVQTASTAQIQSIGNEVREIPVSRRNLQNVVLLAPGVNSSDNAVAGGRPFRVNGVGDGGNALTVDGSSAQTNPENRGFGNYGGQNQIEILSVEAVAEVQVVKGVLAAEYGGSLGGQVNMITRSGTNQFHGSVLENYQNDAFFSRDPFLPSTTRKPDVKFNQFGGSLGGPIVPNRVLFFSTFEGYREDSGITRQVNTPTQATRDRIMAALPFPETRIALDAMPMPNSPLNDVIGLYTDAKRLIRRDNTFLGKVDVETGRGRFSVTASRMQPYAQNPAAEIGNDTVFQNGSSRIATQYVFTANNWVSESRFGWNRNTLDRYQQLWFAESPSRGPQSDFIDVRKRVGNFGVIGLFTTPTTEVLDLNYDAFNFDQKFTRIKGAHAYKLGFRWAREVGFKSNPQSNQFRYQTLNELLENRPTTFLLSMGNPPHSAWLDQLGGFLQDDWRLHKRVVLNLGLRYDYYPAFRYKATTDEPAEINNLNNPTDLRRMDFGAPRDPQDVFEPDRVNFAPRVGFAWTLDDAGATVVRGGMAVYTSGHLMAMFQNAVARPFSPVRQGWNAQEIAARGVQWPQYAEELNDIVIRDAAGRKNLYYLIQNDIKSPETRQTTLDVQRQIGRSMMVSAGYVHTDGKHLPIVRNFALAFDRQTGARPNPAVNPGGWYVTSSQTLRYNALESSFRYNGVRGFETSVHYTLGKGWAQQGGNLVGNFNSTVGGTYFQTQDFFDPNFDLSPLADEVRHRVVGTTVYELPWWNDRKDVLGYALGGWQVSAVVNVRSGEPLRIEQPSGMGNSRPDYNGRNQVFDDWRDTLQYLDRAAYDLVPTSATTRATLRPGTQNPSQVRGPGRRRVDIAIAKSFGLPMGMRLQVRAEAFNAFNWSQYNNPILLLTAPNFGRITGVASTRTGQVGFRLTF